MIFKFCKWRFLICKNDPEHANGQCPGNETKPEPDDKKAISLRDVTFSILTEIAIVLWIYAEFFAAADRPFFAVWLLGVSLLLLVFYIAHKFLEAKLSRPTTTFVEYGRWICSLLVVLGCIWGHRHLKDKFRLENEPRVFPSEVKLHEGVNDFETRTLIINPSDSWIYQVMLLIQIEHNAASITTVQSTLASPPSDSNDHTNQLLELRPTDLTDDISLDHYGFDLVTPSTTGRLLIIYAMAPKEQRVFWLRGTAQTNSIARISIIEWTYTPLSLAATSNETFWPGPTSNSPFWNYFPGVPRQNLGSYVGRGKPPVSDSNFLVFPLLKTNR